MKTLLLVRHAKSSWSHQGLEDIDRPLNDRGKKDAPEMAKRLIDKAIKIDAFISSPAKRARRTARHFAEAYDLSKKSVFEENKLYPASVPAFYEVIKDLKDEYQTVCLFSHNPAITEFVNTLTNVRIDNMPTCSVFAVSVDTLRWKEFEKCEKNFLFFDYPKNPLE